MAAAGGNIILFFSKIINTQIVTIAQTKYKGSSKYTLKNSLPIEPTRAVIPINTTIFFAFFLAGLLISENSIKVTIRGGAIKNKLFVITGNNATNNIIVKDLKYLIIIFFI